MTMQTIEKHWKKWEQSLSFLNLLRETHHVSLFLFGVGSYTIKKEHLFLKKTCNEIQNPYNDYIKLGNRNKNRNRKTRLRKRL